MRLLNVVAAGLMAVVAILFGLIAALVVAITTGVVVVLRRLRGPSRAAVATGDQTMQATPDSTRPIRADLRGAGETIEVTAVEVPNERTAAR